MRELNLTNESPKSNCEVEVSLAKLLMFRLKEETEESLTTNAFRFANTFSAATPGLCFWVVSCAF